MDLGIIVAISSNNVIGRGEKLPWNIPEDLKHFKELTMGCPIIMGRKTYESIGKPLLGRRNLVITSQKIVGDVEIVSSLDDAISSINLDNCNRAYVIGGKRLYDDALKVADFLEITEVHRDVEGDVYFPEVNWDNWKEVGRKDKDEYSFVSYRRK